MYKKQMTFQKIVCYLLLISGALVFIYSLGLLTDIYDSLYFTMMNPDDFEDTWVTGSKIYYDMQAFNKSLTTAGIVLILVSLFNFVTGTAKRRKYYIGNYVSAIITLIANIGITVWALSNIAMYKVQYLTTVDFEALKEFVEIFDGKYTESTFWFDLGSFVFAIVIIATVVFVLNFVWKIIVMKEEKRLIDAGKVEA